MAWGASSPRAHRPDRSLRRVTNRSAKQTPDVGRLLDEPDELRIELVAGILTQLLQRSEGGKSLSVGPVGGHRIESVGDHDDAGPDRDLPTRKPFRVPCAVKVLVMMLDGRLDCTSELRNRADQVRAPNWMFLHQDPLFWTQLAILAEEGSEVFVDF